MSVTTDHTDNLPVLSKRALGAITEGKPFREALALLAPATSAVERTQDLPKPFKLSPEQTKALAEIRTFLDKRCVTPETRRALTESEIECLIDERNLLDVVEALVKERKESIRAAVFNHLDVKLEEDGATNGLIIDAKNHYCAPGKVSVPSRAQALVREITEGSPTLSAGDLEAVIEDDPAADFTHEDYIACTTPVRVFDEAKATLHMRKKPRIIEGFRRAVQTPVPQAKHNKRKA